jgi:nitric oxide dioxygenase
MTPEQIALVEESWAALSGSRDDVAADFYQRLFAAEPAVVELFGTEPAEQRAKFTTELRQIIFSIRQHEAFLGRARALGARHKAYGVRAAHYRLVEMALLGALAAALGDRWTDDMARAWQLAYRLTAEAMLAGAADVVTAERPAD